MGSVGENYSLAMRLIPMTYRVWQSPATIYDSMIFVPTTTPTVILPSELGRYEENRNEPENWSSQLYRQSACRAGYLSSGQSRMDRRSGDGVPVLHLLGTRNKLKLQNNGGFNV